LLAFCGAAETGSVTDSLEEVSLLVPRPYTLMITITRLTAAVSTTTKIVLASKRTTTLLYVPAPSRHDLSRIVFENG
jgi:hypothetical protein